MRSWTYDGHGAITGYTETAADADNSADVRVEVIRDEAGRIVGVDSAAGLITYAYDGAGQLVSARRGNERMSWVWDAAGCLIREEYTRNTTAAGEGATDNAATEAAGWVRVLVYDDAAQVRAIGTYTAASVADNADSGAEQVREFLSGGNASEFTAQLPERVDLNFASDGRTVEGLPLTLVRLYSYDAVGRRAGEVASDGSSVTMGYSLAGSIASVTTADSGSCARVQVAAGVAGEVAGISSLASGWIPVVMDPTAEVPTVVGVGEMPVPTPGVSMLGASASGGSGVRGTSSSVLAGGAGVLGGFTSNAGVSSVPGLASSAGLLDPFQLPTTPLTGSDAAVAGAVPGVGVDASGALTVGGFALMGARVADPVSRSFTSRDPLLPVPGAGWVGNPYSLIGNNPVGLVDPWGLSPISREELDKARYEKSLAKTLDDNSGLIKGVLTGVGIAASVLGFIAAGPVALVVLGAVAGAAMAGASAIEENKGPDGRINWGNVGRDMLIGGAFGALGGGVTKLGSSAMTKVLSTRAINATKPMMQATKATRMFRAARTRAIIGGTSGAANSFTQGFRDLAFDKLYEGKEGYEPKYSLQNHLASTAVGGLTGSVSGLVSPAAGSLSKNPIKVGNVTLNNRRVLETAINGGVSFTGSVVEDLASGKEVSWSKAAVEGTSGSFNGYKNFKAPTRADASTIQQLGYKSPNYLRTYLPSKHGATNLEGTMEDLAKDNVTSYFKKKASGED